MKETMKQLILLIMTTASSAAQPAITPEAHTRPPEVVVRLLEYPGEAVLRHKGLPAASSNLVGVLCDAERWVRLVVDGEWLPERLDPVCTAGEFDGRDVVRYRWEARRHSLLVAQTASVLALEIRPEASVLAGQTKEERLEAVKRVFREVFRKTGVRPDFQGGDIEIPDLGIKLLEFSFSSDMTVETEGDTPRLSGRSKRAGEDGTKFPDTLADAALESEAWQKGNWADTRVAWMFWFRNVHWYADRDRVVVFFLKAEGGPVPMSFDGWFDDQWFPK
jgi:hypothetical protein